MKANPRSKRPTLTESGEITRGNVTVKVYAGKNRVGDKEYPQFTVVYYDGTKRVKKRFADLELARTEAELAAVKLANGENEVLRLTSEDRAVYVRAQERLKAVGTPLDAAVLEYVSAVKQLPEGATLAEAVNYFRRRNPASLEKRTVRQVVDEMLADKRLNSLSKVHMQDLESRLGKLASAFQMNIGGLSGPMLKLWLNDMGCTRRTKQNYLTIIRGLFRFAIAHKYLAKDSLEELEFVDLGKRKATEIEIFTPVEMIEILNAARPEMVPWLAIAGFSGLRSAELERLDWSEVNLTAAELEDRLIEIKAKNSKTALRRHAPITDNLAAWLAPYRKAFGPVNAFESWWNQIPKLVRTINKLRADRGETRKFKWRTNAMRHSFCSYRLAIVKSAAEVSIEAGHSPKMLYANYRKLVNESEARKWFGILPAGERNILPMPMTKAEIA